MRGKGAKKTTAIALTTPIPTTVLGVRFVEKHRVDVSLTRQLPHHLVYKEVRRRRDAEIPRRTATIFVDAAVAMAIFHPEVVIAWVRVSCLLEGVPAECHLCPPRV